MSFISPGNKSRNPVHLCFDFKLTLHIKTFNSHVHFGLYKIEQLRAKPFRVRSIVIAAIHFATIRSFSSALFGTRPPTPRILLLVGTNVSFKFQKTGVELVGFPNPHLVGPPPQDPALSFPPPRPPTEFSRTESTAADASTSDASGTLASESSGQQPADEAVAEF